jgi:3-hydroxyethyl bacteriochlorophyllide a dehydrogenase
VPAASGCDARAVVFDAPGQLSVQTVRTAELAPGDLLVDVHASGISTGTERLLWNGEMPDFPGMGYPLIPGYEAVGEIKAVGSACDRQLGEFVFVGGSQSFPTMRSLFGGAASRLVVPQQKAVPIDASLGTNGLLLALAATAHHILFTDQHPDSKTFVAPDLIIGHGVLGRLLARICIALDFAAPTVWEIERVRQHGADNYRVIDPQQDSDSTYQHIVDVSGNSDILDTAIRHLHRRQPNSAPPQITLAGFYKDSLSFQFAAAFMKEVRIQVAAEWHANDMRAVSQLVKTGLLSLDGLITHTAHVDDAAQAYKTAFSDQQCLKMALDWRKVHE